MFVNNQKAIVEAGFLSFFIISWEIGGEEAIDSVRCLIYPDVYFSFVVGFVVENRSFYFNM